MSAPAVPVTAPFTQSGMDTWLRKAALSINLINGVQGKLHTKEIDADYTIDGRFDFIKQGLVLLVDTTAGNVTVTLPVAAQNPGAVLFVKRMTAGANSLTVDGNGSETIDGSATLSLSSQYEAVGLSSDGSNWIRTIYSPGAGGGTTTNALTITNTGGAAAGATFNGSAPITIDYSTVGAAAASHTHAQADITNLVSDLAGKQPLDTDLSSISDLTFSQGDLIYRDASQLQRLAAGTAGQVLQTGGTGANPSWATPSAPWRAAGGAYAAAGVWDFSVDGATANIDFTGLAGATDIRLIMEAVTKVNSGAPVAYVSVNNGSAWFTTSGDYAFASTSGVRSNADSMAQFHLTNATAARDAIVEIQNANKPRPVGLNVTVQASHRLFLASTSPINAVRIVNTAGGNFNGGKFYCLVR